MNNHRFVTASIIPLLFCAGCAVPSKPAPSQTTDLIIPSADAGTAPVAQRHTDGLTSELVYDTLAGEIASQRGAHQQAFEHAMRAAEQSRDPSAAERATHMALQANLSIKALKATQLWIELAPNSLKAHQLAALLYLRNKDLPQAVQHLQQVARIANDNGQTGYLQAAAIAEKIGPPQQALAVIQQVIPEHTEDPEALYALSLTASHAKQYSQAEQAIRRALLIKPDWPKGLLILSRTLIVQGKKSEGLQVLSQAVDKTPENFELRLTYARMLVEAQQLEPALSQFDILHKIQPDNPDITYALGVLSTELERYDAAKDYFLRLIEAGQKQDDANYHLGFIAEKNKDLESAFERFQRVGGANQTDARIHMARILAEKGRVNEARELLQQLRINAPQHGLRLYLIEAELLRDAQQYAIAHDVYSHAIEVYENNPDLLYARALNAANLNRIDLLERDLNQILATQPDHADALNALGFTLADQTDRLEEARGYIQKALALKPNNPAILDSMGWVEYRLGNLQQALNYLQQAAKITQDAEIASHLGEVLWKLNKKAEARKIWREANEKAPDNPFIAPVMQRLEADR